MERIEPREEGGMIEVEAAQRFVYLSVKQGSCSTFVVADLFCTTENPCPLTTMALAPALIRVFTQ